MLFDFFYPEWKKIVITLCLQRISVRMEASFSFMALLRYQPIGLLFSSFHRDNSGVLQIKYLVKPQKFRFLLKAQQPYTGAIMVSLTAPNQSFRENQQNISAEDIYNMSTNSATFGLKSFST